ncbi:MAG: GTP-binding protein, partial [Candidatus Gastranaerophilales bacterium]|nr:GTP-binding protein [Candidatus Gastranaerophilales bacterium]
MTNFNSADIRNVALVSHVGTGKTSLAEAMLFNAGQNTRLGKVDNETSLLDYEPEEIKRRTTISTSLANFDWKGKRINLLDTPGSPNFAADTISSMQGVDSIVLVIDAIDGIRIQSSKFLKQAKELGLSVVVFINKLERENANYKKVLEDIKGSFEGTPVPVQLPIGQEMSFKGIVNLIENKGYIFEHDESGKFAEVEVPADMQDDVSSTREASIESIVECDDEILEKYLEGQDLTTEDINKAFRAGVVSGQIVPVLFGAATKNIGVSHLLDMIANYMPSPLEKQPVKAKTTQGQDIEIKPVENDPLAALVFKTIADPYAGQLNLM